MDDIRIHEKYMERCLQLAALAAGSVAPNPMVGALLVYNDSVIGEGFHRRYGESHAEVNCIKNVSYHNRSIIPDSTLYISLEPCNHFGNTPPCTELIINSGIKIVVIACRDPYEKVNGSGVEKLRSAGINVLENVLEEKARSLNKRFFTFHQQQRPYIILKWAQSKNNFISEKNENSKITNVVTDRLVHKWRSEESAILVGKNTALTDDPSLTTRLYPGKDPVRLLIDRHLSVPATHKLLSDECATIIINIIKQDDRSNKMYYKIGKEDNVVGVIINLLHQHKLNSLIVEGGAETINYFLDSGLWDEARIITGELIIKNGIPAPVACGKVVFEEKIMNDIIEYRINDKN